MTKVNIVLVRYIPDLLGQGNTQNIWTTMDPSWPPRRGAHPHRLIPHVLPMWSMITILSSMTPAWGWNLGDKAGSEHPPPRGPRRGPNLVLSCLFQFGQASRKTFHSFIMCLETTTQIESPRLGAHSGSVALRFKVFFLRPGVRMARILLDFQTIWTSF